MADTSNQYDRSLREKSLCEERAKLRAALKEEYLKQVTNPFRHGKGGYPFDPAIQRVMAMKTTRYSHFVPTPKNGLFYFSFVILPILAYSYVLKRDRDIFEGKCRRGEIAYKDRLFKFI